MIPFRQRGKEAVLYYGSTFGSLVSPKNIEFSKLFWCPDIEICPLRGGTKYAKLMVASVTRSTKPHCLS